MSRSIASLTFLVREYDEAIAFFTDALGFELVEDTEMGNDKRWVVVKPRGDGGATLLLGRATSDEQRTQVGHQAGGRVFLFLRTDDFWGDLHRMREHGVRFTEEPRDEPYGTVVVFLDCYGNKWDLVQLRSRPS